MEDNRQGLFRAKNIERIESPESMNDYLQVTSPGVWLVLSYPQAFVIRTVSTNGYKKRRFSVDSLKTCG